MSYQRMLSERKGVMKPKTLKEWCDWQYENDHEYRKIVDDLKASGVNPLDRSSCVIEKVDGHYRYAE